jgi:hypothetical protein
VTRLNVPFVLADFQAYHAANPTWGSLHVILDDGNYSDSSVRYCVHSAAESGDVEGERLARILLSMSTTQRRKLARLA